ncbi:MAG: YeeE/YedE family protein [Woeseiaceae bacterium]
MMLEIDYLRAAVGGALIGLAAVLLLWLNGRIAGISGIMNGVFTRSAQEYGWRIAFLVGLVAGGLLFQSLAEAPLMERTNFPIWMTIVAGLLVGYGTRLGSGCTSGHGVCGVSRLSVRSMVATATFVGIGMLIATAISRVMS